MIAPPMTAPVRCSAPAAPPARPAWPSGIRRALAWLALWPALACATDGLPAPHETGQLFLWEVEAPEVGRAWLLGSVHVGAGEPDLDPAIRAAFDDTQTLVTEVDPAELEPVRAAQLMLERGQLPPGQTLRDWLPAPAWARLQEELAQRGLPLLAYARLEPWVVMLMLTTQQFAEEGYAPEAGVDRWFQDRADAKPVIGLETLESQIAVFDAMPMELQVEALVGTLERPSDEGGLSPGQLLEAWRLGDAEALASMIFVDRGRDPRLDALYEALYFRRNREMSRRIAELVSEGGSYFVVVGAGHMLGAQGIPALLAERGFRVQRVPKTR